MRLQEAPTDSRMGSAIKTVTFRDRIASFVTLQAFLAPGIRFDGADISHHQVDNKAPIDWEALRGSSWWFATKATQGTRYVDPTFATHRAKAAELGFSHRIFYHWLTPTADPTAQAIWFMSVVGKLEPGEGVMLDVEEAGVTRAMVLQWCAVVESVYKRPVIIYTGAYVAGGTIWQSTEVRTSPYGPRAMHLAAYTTETRMLSLPGLKAYPQSAWQYSSDGPVAGIDGRCDMNRIDIRDHYDLACGVVPAPAPIVEPEVQEDDNVTVYYLAPWDDPARFIGVGSAGMVPAARWTGDGNLPDVQAKIAFYLNAGATEMVLSKANFKNVALDGELPPGWVPDDFANPDEIRRRIAVPVVEAVDQVARDGAIRASNEAQAAHDRADEAQAIATTLSGKFATFVAGLKALV